MLKYKRIAEKQTNRDRQTDKQTNIQTGKHIGEANTCLSALRGLAATIHFMLMNNYNIFVGKLCKTNNGVGINI